MKKLFVIILIVASLSVALYAEAGMTMATGFSMFSDSRLQYILNGVYFDYGVLADITGSGNIKFDGGLRMEAAVDSWNTDIFLFRLTLSSGMMVKAFSPLDFEILPALSWILLPSEEKNESSAFDFTVGGIVNFSTDLGRGEMVLLHVGTDIEYGLLEKRLFYGFSCGVKFFI